MFTAPERTPAGNERWIAWGIGLALAALFAVEVFRDFHPVKLSIVFMVLLLGPMLLIHELGHALVSVWMGWKVCRMVIGHGRPVLRVRWGDIPIDICVLPIGGHVVPAPRRLRRPRLENALIYAAGPGAELLVALVAMLIVGPRTFFSASDSVPVIFAQSVGLLVAVDLFFNLVPLPVGGEDAAHTDGLGMMMSPALPDWYFHRAMVLPWVLEAEQCREPAERVRVFEAGLAELPHNPFLHLAMADALEEVGDLLVARQHRLEALRSPHVPEGLRERLRKRVG